jgi:hypothetical protein
LDLLCAAVTYRQEGKLTAAAKCFEAAVKDKSISAALRIVESSNAPAHSQLVRASRLKAGTDAFGELDQDIGNELKIEPEENGDRIVQEAGADEDDDGEDGEYGDYEKVESSIRRIQSGRLPIRAMSKDEIRTMRAKMKEWGFNFSGRTITKETDAPHMIFSKKGVTLTLSGKLSGDTMTTKLDVEGGEDDADTKAAVKFLQNYVGKQKVSAAASDDVEAGFDDLDDLDDLDDVSAAFRTSASTRRPAQRTTANSDFSRALKNLHALSGGK